MLSILHVYPVVSRYLDIRTPVEIPVKMNELKLRMNQLAQDFMENPDDKIQNVVLSGNVEETMLRFIKENNFDLVILGINGNGSDNNMGSHTLSIIEKSGTPVMVIPNEITYHAGASSR